jgi:lipopolysaccharide transport system ATP-binding protein
MVAVQSLCHHTVWLERGRLKESGPAALVIGSYHSDGMRSNYASDWEDPATAPGNAMMRIRRISISDDNEPECTMLTMQTEIRIETEYTVGETDDLLHITYHLLNDRGITVLTSWSKPTVYSARKYRAVCKIPGNLLNSGKYSLNLFIVRNENSVIYSKEDMASFDVKDMAQRDTAYLGREPGIVQPSLEWRIEGPLRQ